MSDPYKTYLTVSEVAKILDVHAETVRKWIRDKKIRAIRGGPSKRSPFRIPRDEIDSIVEPPAAS